VNKAYNIIFALNLFTVLYSFFTHKMYLSSTRLHLKKIRRFILNLSLVFENRSLKDGL
jgi:hypothetical protein